MKEFVEKLIGRLEEYKYSHLVECDSESVKHCVENEKHCEGNDCILCVWDKSKEIVNQLAEEYINCSTNISTDKSTTNADRIRSMSDEELAKFIRAVECCSRYSADCGFPFCPSMEGNLCNGIKEKTEQYILDWLQSEVKGSE